MPTVFARRFNELCEQAEAIESTKRIENPQYGVRGYRVDPLALLNWQVKVRHLIGAVCGEESSHFKAFTEREHGGWYSSNHDVFKGLEAVLLAAKEDYEGGYLNKLRHLIQAEVFGSELEQADELLASGYISAAAVIAGVVLETGLREMCADSGIEVGKLDRMNADLAKAGVYNKLTQKQITALTEIRNSAAHGKFEQFDKDDVSNMIRDVERILASGGH
jgi:hypothetical protein